jgi:cathepsin C
MQPLRTAAAAALGLAACFVPSAWADLPVHCLRSQVVGTWTFVVGQPSATRSVCGHARPDVEEKQPARKLVDDMSHEELTVQLLDPNTAKAGAQSGTWTMVYDEGFEVRLGKKVFFAFSNFTYASGFSLTGGHITRNTSHCGDTMVGWYGNSDRTEFGCYYGFKKGASPLATAGPAQKKTVLATATTYDKLLDHKTQVARVAKLNNKLSMLQASWTARVMPQFNGRSLRNLNNYAGLKRKTPVRDLQRDMLEQRRPLATRSFLQRQDRVKKARSGEVPATFDWSDVNGMDYTEPVMDQGDCGSCYDASTMRMLSARHKITQNDTEALPWSINFPLFCAEFNQGCKGGFGFLTNKWSEEIGLLPATCMRYNTAGSCKLECDLDKDLKGQKRYRAANHRYVSSFYGNFSTNNAAAIKEELYRNGPVVLSFEPSEDFMFYSGGIFNSTREEDKKGLVFHVDYDQEWTRVDHAVVAVGYGEENGQKYWKIMNSWGTDWGEDGYFRMAMGHDESGVESGAEAADVVEDEQVGRQVAALFAEHAKAAQ